MANVVFTKAAWASVKAMEYPIRGRIDEIVGRLEHWPRVSGAKPMRGALAGRYRIRTGDYRVLFSILGMGSDATVVIEAVGHRDGFYDA